MISPGYYKNSRNRGKVYLGAIREHFLQKPRIVVLDSYDYIISDGEDMYSLATKVFGKDNQHLWTIIADLNPLRMPDDWVPGDTVKLPLIIVQESSIPPKQLTNGQSFTTVL